MRFYKSAKTPPTEADGVSETAHKPFPLSQEAVCMRGSYACALSLRSLYSIAPPPIISASATNRITCIAIGT